MLKLGLPIRQNLEQRVQLSAFRQHGTWLQLSVFQCRLTARRRVQLGAKLDRIIRAGDDHVVIVDVGPADAVDPRVESLGKAYRPVERKVTVI